MNILTKKDDVSKIHPQTWYLINTFLTLTGLKLKSQSTGLISEKIIEFLSSNKLRSRMINSVKLNGHRYLQFCVDRLDIFK